MTLALIYKPIAVAAFSPLVINNLIQFFSEKLFTAASEDIMGAYIPLLPESRTFQVPLRDQDVAYFPSNTVYLVRRMFNII